MTHEQDQAQAQRIADQFRRRCGYEQTKHDEIIDAEEAVARMLAEDKTKRTGEQRWER